jgi:Overcoming lysogenization defect protein-like, TOPRIM domain
MWTPASVEKLELATRSGRLVEKKRFEAKREVGRDKDVAIDVNAMALDGGAVVYDPDREAISIIECGGKPNIPLFTRICRGTGIPFVVVHDSDRKASGRLATAEGY